MVVDKADQDTWKVVSKPRRQKKSGKDKLAGIFRQEEGGSRFGVLAEKEVVGGFDPTGPSQPPVQSVAVEMHDALVPFVAQGSSDCKADGKKKQSRKQLNAGSGSGQKSNKPRLRKEK